MPNLMLHTKEEVGLPAWSHTARNQRRPPPSDRRTSSRRPPQRRWRKHIDGAAAAGRLSREQGSCREKHCIFVSVYSVGAGTSFEHHRTPLDKTDSTQVESRPNSHGAKTYAVLKFLMGRLSCRGFCHWASVARAKRWGGDRRPSLRGGDRRRLW